MTAVTLAMTLQETAEEVGHSLIAIGMVVGRGMIIVFTAMTCILDLEAVDSGDQAVLLECWCVEKEKLDNYTWACTELLLLQPLTKMKQDLVLQGFVRRIWRWPSTVINSQSVHAFHIARHQPNVASCCLR